MSESTLSFSLKKSGEYGKLPKILVMGVGGGGCNAVNNMLSKDIKGVDFIAVNTDTQSLERSMASRVIQLGEKITGGQGAGSYPEVGLSAAEESKDQIVEALKGVQLLFLAAGMGGGTGTGATPYIAKLAKEMDILTVAVVTKPFQFEAEVRSRLAEQGIAELRKYVDTMIVLPNENLFRIANKETTLKDAFGSSDNVLYLGIRGITDLITTPGLINLDFADVRMVIKKMGRAMMGMGEAEGENRAIKAVEEALSNPLLEDVNIKGATGALINITGSPDITLFEFDEAAKRIREEIGGEDAIIKVGTAFMKELEGKVRVSIFATGMQESSSVNTIYSNNKNDDIEDDISAQENVGSIDITIEEIQNKKETDVDEDDELPLLNRINTKKEENTTNTDNKHRNFTGKTKLTMSISDDDNKNDNYFQFSEPIIEDDIDDGKKEASSLFNFFGSIISKKKDKKEEAKPESVTFKTKNREIEFKNNSGNDDVNENMLEIPAYLRKKK